MKKAHFLAGGMILIPLLGGCTSDRGSQHRSEYMGQEQRPIKSLSSDDLDELRTGQGWGLAKAAELNGLPGPAHLLQMKEEIDLSEEQLARIEEVYAGMKEQAIPLGLELVELENKLDKAFATRTMDRELLEQLLGQIAEVYKNLRYVHLSAHLDVSDILTPLQVERYNQLRGYAEEDPCSAIPAGHDPEMWRKHNNCD